jgi:cytoskeletal protein CcmA (bactofilin family)
LGRITGNHQPEHTDASGLTIEGKINGNGHVRVAGRFKGDVQVEGNLHIDSGAKVEGQVKASEVIVSGELQGNIDGAKRVELQQGGTITGDVKAGSLTVAAGARMRGNVDFGFDEGQKSGSASNTTSFTDRSRGTNVA